MRLFPLLVLLCLLPAPLLATQAVTCHCFQDRVYDPQRPTAADAFFLSTLQNSLYAAVSGTEKREVVKAKTKGAAGDELWVSWALAAAAKLPQSTVAQAREGGRSWRQVAATLDIPLERLAPPLVSALQREATTAELATLVVDGVLSRRLGASAAELAQLRRADADDHQAIAAVFLARRSGRTPSDRLAAVQRGGQSWSELLAKAGVGAENAETVLRGLLQK